MRSCILGTTLHLTTHKNEHQQRAELGWIQIYVRACQGACRSVRGLDATGVREVAQARTPSTLDCFMCPVQSPPTDLSLVLTIPWVPLHLRRVLKYERPSGARYDTG